MLQVGSGRGAAEPSAEPEVSTLAGKIASRKGSQLTVEVAGGKRVVCRVAEGLRDVLSKARVGDKILAVYEVVGKQRVITNLILRGR